jgi:DNA helicase-2/ATP-dependent DNA helicase PcrA
MKDEREFNNAYSKLNKAQKEAVDAIEAGPVMVIAGPGTGKTQILTLRIANILAKTQTPPDAILALTFTDAGVNAMRKRLAHFIGATAYRVPIFTFHGFCNEVITSFSSHFPELVGSRPATQLDQITLMQKVFDNSKLEKLASFRSPYYYVNKVLHAVSLLKREAITPALLRTMLDEELARIQSAEDYRHLKGAYKGKVKNDYLKAEESIEKNRELADLYESYESLLAVAELYDFDDMILSVVQKLESDEDLRLILQEEYQCILADEHQDANGAQNKVLELLSSFHDSPDLFIVGDDKQAIYRFQGASLENFKYFHRKFPSAKLITLEDNYRSTQSVLDSAHKLIADESKRLLAKSTREEKTIAINEYETVGHEGRVLATKIKKLIEDGEKPEEIAVFTRTNAELGIYSEALIRAGVPLSLKTSKDALDDIDLEKLIILIRASATVGEDDWFIKALHLSCFKISELDIYTLARQALKKRKSVWSLLESVDEVKSLGLINSVEIIRVRDLILQWAKEGANISPAELVSKIAKESGLMAEVIGKPDAEDKLAMIALLISYLKDFVKTKRGARIRDLSELLDILDEYDVLETNLSGHSTGRVQMMTAHKSKGLEFDHVFIVGAVEGNWSGGRSKTDFKIPGLVSVSKEDEEADDRRLFYVALTRAKKELNISYAKIKEGGKEVLPSRFVDELPTELTSRRSFKDDADIATHADALSVSQLEAPSIESIKNFVRETLQDRGLAVSGLNNYLSCPWRYFYRNMLRVPEVETPSLLFGTSIHAALKIFFDALADDVVMTKEELFKRFEYELAKQPLTDKEMVPLIKEGREALGGYLEHYKGNFEKDVKNEFSVDAILSIGDFDLRLTGSLDKIEFLKDGGVSVVDYKTGKHKTKNEMEGKTKDSDGNYKRQLVFYNLLLNRYNNGSYSMKSGVIDFVEPDTKGKYLRVPFVVTSEEVEELEGVIKNSVEEILNLSFWDKRCEDEECEYCKLRQMMN